MSDGSPTFRNGWDDPMQSRKAMFVLRPAKKRESTLPREEQQASWLPRTWHPARERLTLLEVTGGVWTFQDPRNDRLYRCEVDPDGSGRWFFKDVRTAN